MASSSQEFIESFAKSIASRNAKTIRAYTAHLRGFADWLATQPGGDPFAPDRITETAVKSYLNHLKKEGRAPSRPKSSEATA